MTRILLLCAGLLGLGGCGGDVGVAMMAASTASFIHTDKTVSDHAVSWSTGSDCSVLHLAEGEDYCKPQEPPERGQVAYMNAALYCYRTLGGVTCYDRPDYTASSETRINFGDTPIPPLNTAPMTAQRPMDAALR